MLFYTFCHKKRESAILRVKIDTPKTYLAVTIKLPMTKKHELPVLPYAFDALEPYIDAQTMEIHYGKHHQAYADKFNTALEKHPELFEKNPEDLLKNLSAVPDDIREAVKNHGGGYVNHTFFWTLLKPAKESNQPDQTVQDALQKTFDSLEKFQEQFRDAALKTFGSGWAWLIQKQDGSLVITSTSNQDSPLSQGDKPILALDVWEHAYYLKYQNKRAEYIEGWWNVVNWDTVKKNLIL